MEAPPDTLNDRVRWLAALGAVAFAALLSRAVYVVVTARPKASPMARRAPVRGSILAADGTVLAESVTGYEVDVAPATLLRAPLAIDRLAAMLGYNDTLSLHGEVQRAATQGTRILRLRRNVESLVAARIRREGRELPGVWITEVPRRRYPLGELTAYPVGFMGDVDERDLAEPVGYRRGDRVGRAGIERAWELTLRGVSSHAPTHEGMTLGTTLDVAMQRAAVSAMGAHDGAVVALDPRDGRVLAYVSRPAVDPMSFEGDAVIDYGAPRQRPRQPLLDRVSDVAMPLHALLSPVASLATLTVGNDATHIQRMARDLGFGVPTGIDLRDEVTGSLRTIPPLVVPRDNADAGRVELAATLLQSAVVYAAIANGGVGYQPHLVDRVLYPDGSVASHVSGVVRSHITLTAGAVAQVLAWLPPAAHGASLLCEEPGPCVALAPAIRPRVVVVASTEPAALAVVRAWLASEGAGAHP